MVTPHWELGMRVHGYWLGSGFSAPRIARIGLGVPTRVRRNAPLVYYWEWDAPVSNLVAVINLPISGDTRSLRVAKRSIEDTYRRVSLMVWFGAWLAWRARRGSAI